MDRRKEIKRQYKETKPQAGVFQVKNNLNGKVFVKSTRNLKTVNGQLMQLNLGSHRNASLQKEWEEYGKDAFTVEVLEVLAVKEGEIINEKNELNHLEEKWLDRLQPYGERGYHARK